MFGTRPEAIKGGPVVAELRALGVPVHVLCTGQHTDLLTGTPADTDLLPDVNLGLPGSGSAGEWLVKHLPRVIREMRMAEHDVVVVQGDTVSAYAGALAAKILGIPVAHVEAGVRSGNWDHPSPEEAIRTAISAIASTHYCHSTACVENLLSEGIEGEIVVTGNPGVSAIQRYASGTGFAFVTKNPMVLVTLHRREWLSQVGAAQAMVQAIGRMAEQRPELDFVWPMHPAVLTPFEKQWRASAAPENFAIVSPFSYPQTIATLRTCVGVLTDSGGLQEEAATLGVPCAVLRVATDRPESVAAGMASLFLPLPSFLPEAVEWLLAPARIRESTQLFGGVNSARNIALHLKALIDS